MRVVAVFEMSEYLQDPTFRSERSLLRQSESDWLRSRRRLIRGRRQICRRDDPMASCLVWTHFCYFIQCLGVYSQWKAKKTQPQLLANLAMATNHTATVPQDRKQQKIASVNRYSSPTLAHQGACSSSSVA